MSLSRFLAASSLIVAPIATLGFGTSAFAQAVNLAGTVPSILTLTTTTTADAGNLNLAGAGATIVVKIADVKVKTNDPDGLTLTVTPGVPATVPSGVTATAGTLGSASGTIAYQTQVVNNDTAFNTVSSGTWTTSGTADVKDYTDLSAESGEKDVDLYIRYTNPSLPLKGTYTGSVTLTVADK